MRSLNHAPTINQIENADTNTTNEQELTIPAVEKLPLTPETRAELDAQFYALIESIDAGVSQAERERTLGKMSGKIDGSYEPPLKKPADS